MTPEQVKRAKRKGLCSTCCRVKRTRGKKTCEGCRERCRLANMLRKSGPVPDEFVFYREAGAGKLIRERLM
jgi:hypothetical protein